MSSDERLLYNVHRCIQPSFESWRRGSYLEHCVQQLNACSHLYSDEVVCGSHASFDQAHAHSLGLVEKERHMQLPYRSQLQAYDRLQRRLNDGTVRADKKAKTKDGKGTYMVYKYTAGHVPGSGYSYGKQPTSTYEEREIYNVGEGDENSSSFPRKPPSIEEPFPHAAFKAATKAFLKTHHKEMLPAPKPTAHEKKMVNMGVMQAPPETVEGWTSYANMTKFSTLMDELVELRTSDPDFRVIVFTRHTFVQERLVKLVSEETKPGGRLAPTESSAKLVVFEFTTKTAPQQRHRLIQQFQDGSKKGARVFVVTYAVAAVGITLTAANRIFLMEPCIDPAQEIQAAGRIHRLGQEKDCFIKRLAFKDSIEEAVIMIHNKIRNKEIAVVDGVVDSAASSKAMREYAANMTTHDRTGGPTRMRTGSGEADATYVNIKLVHGKGAKPEWSHSSEMVKTKKGQKSRSNIWREECEAFEKANTFSYTCRQRACVCCGLYADEPGSFKWKGTGMFAYLNGYTCDLQPVHDSYSYFEAMAFRKVPRPPDGWMGLRPEQTNNGRELPAASAASPSRIRRAGDAISSALSRMTGGGDGAGPSST